MIVPVKINKGISEQLAVVKGANGEVDMSKKLTAVQVAMMAMNQGGGVRSYYETILATEPANLIRYFPMDETSGTTAVDHSGNNGNGTYTDVTLGETGIGDGKTSGQFISAGSRINFSSAATAALFNGQEGTFTCWFKSNSPDDWRSADDHYILYLIVDANNYLFINKRGSDKKLITLYRANGTTFYHVLPFYQVSGWCHLAFTWSLSDGYIHIYLNGVEQNVAAAVTQPWAGSLRTDYGAVIGCLGNAWTKSINGHLAHAALWTKALTEAQIQTLAYKNHVGFEGLMIAFDDQYSSQYSVAYDYMQPRGIPGTMYVCTNNVNTGPAYCTDANLLEMEANGWVIGNHSMSHPLLANLSLEDQQAEIGGAIAALTGWGLSETNAKHFAYPTGNYNANTLTAMGNLGMLTGRVATLVEYSIDPNVNYPYLLDPMWYAANFFTLDDLKDKINIARQRGKWVMIFFHGFADTPATNQWTPANFRALIDWVVEQNIPCKTIADYYAART
jgi:peptidoglycan/xylan/chitin deacetylase (PgdA/CDA1 family)